MSLFNRPRPAGPRQLPTPPSQHQAACTHLTVTRLFGPCVRCQYCHRTPKIGWVYACTQDHDGNLPEIGLFTPCTAPDPKMPVSEEPASSTLSPWIQKAIEQGQYTEAEVERLEAQKRAVRDAIAKVEENLAASSRSSEQSYDGFSTTATETQLDPLRQVSSHSDEEKTNNPPMRGFDGVSDQHPRSVQRISPVCHARICHTCRTSYRERALLPLDNILESVFKPIPQFELNNRRVSDTNVINGIMYRRLRREKRTITDLGRSPIPMNGYSEASYEEVGTPEDMEVTEARMVHHNDGVQDEWHENAPLDAITDESSDDGTGAMGSYAQFSRSMMLCRRRQDTQALENGEVQQAHVGAGSPLPDIAEDFEGSEDGEVVVQDGLAVTEEGISNHTADIITQF